MNAKHIFFQKTLRQWVETRGVGLHSGKPVEISLGPGTTDTGIVFERTDLPGKPKVRCYPASLQESVLCTSLEENGVRVATVEHLLAVLFALGVDNCHVALNGEEVPILDGSAQPWLWLLQEAGLRSQEAYRSWNCLCRTITVRDGDRWIQARPARRLQVSCVLDFDHPLVNDQRLTYHHDSVRFAREIAPARTFGFLDNIASLQEAGLIKGGSLANAVVIDRYSILNEEGLRFPDEFVRHKVLDILGDLSVLGGEFLARIDSHKSGHALHRALARQIAADPNNFMRLRLTPEIHEPTLPFDLAPYRQPASLVA